MRLQRLGFTCASVLLALAWQVEAQSIVTPHDTIPDFCATPSIQSVASGRWSDPATWSPARVPAAGDKVAVTAGRTVVFDVQQAAALDCVGIHGQLTFDTTVTTRLWAGNVLVYGDGYLQIGTVSQPVAPTARAEVVLANKALDPLTDPNQYGTALLGWGKLTIHGAPKQPTFVRVAQEPRAGQTAIVLEEPVTGWGPGDRLVLPDTRHLKSNEITNGFAPITPQWEELTLWSVSADGRTLTLTTALQFDHLGARDANGTVTFLPQAANLSRNVIIRSEAPIGTVGTQGHVLLTYRAEIDVRYARFSDLGRTTTAPLDNLTNHIGRYPIHLHHTIGPVATPATGYQYTLLGNAVDGGSTFHSLKWGVAIHDTHYGLIQDNVAYNYAGSLFVTEDGSESYNVLDHNFAIRSQGSGNRTAGGTEGGGFWFRGPNNRIRRNVAANTWGDQPNTAFGFKFFPYYLGNIKVPNYMGADTSVDGQYSLVNGNNMPLLEFTDNEVYCAAQGFTYWWINSVEEQVQPNPQESVIRNLHIWHVFNIGIFHYAAARMTIDGLVIRGKEPATSACCGIGWYAADYPATDITIRNADIQGLTMGAAPSTAAVGLQTIENSLLQNVTGVYMGTLWSSNDASWLPPRHVIVRNVTFAPWPGSPYTSIAMDWYLRDPFNTNTTQLDELKVYAYQGNPNDNFQAYYSVQATQNIAGGLAPCTATRPEIEGLVCPIPPEAGGGGPPATPTNLQVTQVSP